MRTQAPPLCERATHDDLLQHYLRGAQQTVQSIDQLGNFLMGFGVLALGYLLNADLSPATQVFGSGAGHVASAVLTLGAWGTAVGLLVCFVYTYVFRVIVGRSVHASNGSEASLGEILEAPEDMDWAAFMHDQRTFQDFIKTHYLPRVRQSPEALLYTRWSGMRYLALKKLSAMERMRGLLGLALISGVAFKVLLVYQTAVVA